MSKQDDQNKTHLLDIFLENSTLYNKERIQPNLKIDPLFIKAMLFDMGILGQEFAAEETTAESDVAFA